MKQTKSSSHDLDQLRSQVASEQPETQPLLACLWMAIAFIVGTFVFEMAAAGAEPKADRFEEFPAQLRLGAALDQNETDVSLATSPLESLYRIERNTKLMPLINDIIKTETICLANRESPVELVSHDVSPEDEAGADTIITAIPSATGFRNDSAADLDRPVVTSRGQATRGDDASNDQYSAGSAAQQAGEFEPVYVRSAPTEESDTPSISHPVVVADTNSPTKASGRQPESDQAGTGQNAITSDPQQATVPSPTADAYAAPVSIGTIDVPVRASARSSATAAEAKIVPAQPISLLLVPTTPGNETTVPSEGIDNDDAELLDATFADDETTAGAAQVEFAPAAVAPAAVAPAAVAPAAVAEPATTAVAAVTASQPSAAPPQQPSAAAAPLAAAQASQPIRQPEERIAAKWPFAQPAAANQPGVSLNVDNADVRTVFEMLARGYGMNILVAPDVKGSVTANVDGLTPDQTLQGVMKMCNLRAQVDDNVIYVYPADNLPNDARQLRLFPLDFARAAILEPIVQGLLSPIGNAYASAIDAQDNMKTREAIVVIDTPETIAQIESYIYQADQPPLQVMIEAHVLEVDLKDDFKRGVNLKAILGRDLEVGSFGLTDGTPSATNPLFYAQLKSDDVESLIELVETTTDAKTLASPRVMVVNGQEAKIQVGQQLGFAVATVTQTSTIQDVQFLDTGVVLSVKPTISRDHQILMDVKPEVSSGEINPDTLLPEEETRELQTSILLNNHQGIVIGGLIQERDSTVIRKLPCLGDIKYVGRLFQRREAVRSRSEIIISLVAHIVNLDEHPPQHCDHEEDQIQLQRTQTPLLYGPLQRSCRPWEPRLPDRVSTENCMDANKVNRMIP